MNYLCEVRITTHRRPDWLYHALSTLVSQTHPHWLGIVFDDSPDREGQAVVEKFQDSRIIYSPNPSQLGCTANLNQAFQTAAYYEASYACVLEDDNWFYPEFLRSNIEVLRTSGTKIMQRNQDVWSRYVSPPEQTPIDSLGHWYGPDRLFTPIELHAYMFLFPGVSNGALFWDTRTTSNLQVIERIQDASLQEYARCAQIQEPTAFASKSLAAWADVPLNQARGPAYSGREFGRFLQHLRRQLYAHYGKEIVTTLKRTSQLIGQEDEASRNLLNSMIFDAGNTCSARETLIRLIRGAAKFISTRNIAPNHKIPFSTSTV